MIRRRITTACRLEKKSTEQSSDAGSASAERRLRSYDGDCDVRGAVRIIEKRRKEKSGELLNKHSHTHTQPREQLCEKRKGGENKERYLRRRQCEKERARQRAAGSPSISLSSIIFSLLGELYQRPDRKEGRGEIGGRELGHRAKADRTRARGKEININCVKTERKIWGIRTKKKRTIYNSTN